MNVTVIPFFLAANMIVNDTSEHTSVFGPEYYYFLTLKTYFYPDNLFSTPESVRLFIAMKCRPKVPNRLLCLIPYGSNNTDHNSTRISFPSFEMKYNKRGIESLLINSTFVNTNDEKLNVIKRIADQFNLGINLKENRDTSLFEENTSMGICTTRYEISRKESETVKKNILFTLFVPPMTDTTPETTISIKKLRTRCTNTPRRLHSRVLKMERFFSKIQIGDGTFQSLSELDGKLRTYSHFNETLLLPFHSIMQLDLNTIKPAQNDIPSIVDSGKLYKLNIN